MALVAEKSIEEIRFAEIAKRASVSLADLRGEFGSTIAIIAAFLKDLDRIVLAGSDADVAGEPPRERLFDVLMRRLEALEPHKESVRSLARSVRRNPGLALALNGLAVRSAQWMLEAADISASGPRGVIRAQGLQVLLAPVLNTWLDDDDPGRARTMAALDSALASGQRWAGTLDGLLALPARLCPTRARPRRPGCGRRDDRGLDRHPHRRAQPAHGRIRQRDRRRASARCRVRSRGRGRCRPRPGCGRRRRGSASTSSRRCAGMPGPSSSTVTVSQRWSRCPTIAIERPWRTTQFDTRLAMQRLNAAGRTVTIGWPWNAAVVEWPCRSASALSSSTNMPMSVGADCSQKSPRANAR